MFERATALKPFIGRVLAFARMLLGLDQPTLYRPEAHYMRGPGPKWRAKHSTKERRFFTIQ